MKKFVSTIGNNGRILLDVRRHLGVDTSDKIILVVAGDGSVEVRSVRYRVRDRRGIVPALPGRETVDFDDQVAEAFNDDADAVIAGRCTANKHQLATFYEQLGSLPEIHRWQP